MQPDLISRLFRFLAHQPLGETASAPFRTDIRSGTQNHIKPEILGHLQERLQIPQVDLRIVPDGTGHIPLVPVPRDVGLHTIETRSLQFSEAIGPQRTGHPEIMERTAENENVLSFYLEATMVVTYTVGMQEDCIRNRRIRPDIQHLTVGRFVIHYSQVGHILSGSYNGPPTESKRKPRDFCHIHENL